LLTVLLVFVGYTNAHSDAATQLGRVAALQLELARTKPATAVKTVDTSELTSSRTARRAALQVALSRQMAWDRTLGDVARVLPSSVWLTDLTAVSPTPADSTAVTSTSATTTGAGPSSGTSGFTINGYTLTMDDVALLLQRLQLLPTLTNVTLTSTAGTAIGEKPVVQFSIAASIVAPTTATPPPTTTVPTTTTGTTP
jgi:Tfp pilus assembly protein PilN